MLAARATRIRKRTCHIVVIVSRMPEELLEKQRARDEAKPSNRAARRSGQQAQAARRERVARSRAAAAADAEPHDHDHAEGEEHDHDHDEHEDVVEPEMVEVEEVDLDDVAEDVAPEAVEEADEARSRRGVSRGGHDEATATEGTEPK